MAGSPTNDAWARLSSALADRYLIERELGAGGMATVYLADDLKHHRKVALKVMRPELAAVIGAERFLIEITTTANLQHPHILPLFDSGTVNGTVFYVMPFVEGESLRDRLDREKQLPVEDAVRIASEVGAALQYAHSRGVIHRDIKPENILLHDGNALVADFGIALAASRTGSTRMTETGMSLGTPTYMSPEQAMGERTLDARTDIYALGCVLYEMLVGDPPHTGSTAQAIVAKVITEKPVSITASRGRVPLYVEDAVMTALEKLPADRFANAGEFVQALAGKSTSQRATQRSAAAAHSRRLSVPMLIGVVALIASSAGWMVRGARSRVAPVEPITFATTLGRPGVDGPYVSLSPDGRKIAASVTDTAGNFQVGVRDLGTNTVTAIAGTEHGFTPEFSPDGAWIAFVADGKLRKVAVQGGPATTVFDAFTVDGCGLAWTSNGDIIFPGRGKGLFRISSSGGAAVQLTHLDASHKEFGHWYPRMLPGGRAFIYTNYASLSHIEAYDFKTKRTTVLADHAIFGRYSPTGHLLYARDAAVYAVGMDPAKLKTYGTAVPVQDSVVWEETNGLAGFDVSANGTFIYLRESEWSRPGTLAWRDRAGDNTPVMAEPGAFIEPRLSPDGRWIAVTVMKPKLEIWLYDVARHVFSQLTHAPGSAFDAAWLPDSRRIIYSFEAPVYDLHTIAIDGSTADHALISSKYDKMTTSVSRDGKQILIAETFSGRRLLIANTDGSGVHPLPESGLERGLAVFSPDAKWIAYVEQAANGPAVFIGAADGSGGRRLVSSNGTQPRWTKGGHELVYISGTSMMAVPVDPATGDVGAPQTLFRVTDIDRSVGLSRQSYDVTADGEHFLVIMPVVRNDTQPLIVELNWRPRIGATEEKN